MPKRTSKGPTSREPEPGSFAARYPHIADWVTDGLVEIGQFDYPPSFVRALDEGGIIWEGASRCQSLDAALRALDGGIAAWLKGNR
jgi:hypothetical protein